MTENNPDLLASVPMWKGNDLAIVMTNRHVVYATDQTLRIIFADDDPAGNTIARSGVAMSRSDGEALLASLQLVLKPKERRQ
jgi:hypothetical protein